MKVVATWPVLGAKSNFPMALDEAHHRLFVGCRRPSKVLVFDTATGRASGSFDIVGDTDNLFYDAARKRLYMSGGEGYLDVFQEQDVNRFARIAHVATAAGARTSLFVPEQNRLYLAVPAEAHKGGGPRLPDAMTRRLLDANGVQKFVRKSAGVGTSSSSRSHRVDQEHFVTLLVLHFLVTRRFEAGSDRLHHRAGPRYQGLGFESQRSPTEAAACWPAAGGISWPARRRSQAQSTAARSTPDRRTSPRKAKGSRRCPMAD